MKEKMFKTGLIVIAALCSSTLYAQAAGTVVEREGFFDGEWELGVGQLGIMLSTGYTDQGSDAEEDPNGVDSTDFFGGGGEFTFMNHKVRDDGILWGYGLKTGIFLHTISSGLDMVQIPLVLAIHGGEALWGLELYAGLETVFGNTYFLSDGASSFFKIGPTFGAKAGYIISMDIGATLMNSELLPRIGFGIDLTRLVTF